jgi:hypothetical protein
MRSGIITLVVTGAFIFLATQLVLKAMGRPATLSKENPFDQLATQTPLSIPCAYPSSRPPPAIRSIGSIQPL